jgi:HK97 family phage portal protein
MAVIQSDIGLVNVQPDWWPLLATSRSSLSFYNQYNYDYATIYRTQPNVRTCVDFLARNIAQLGLHVFRRVSDTDRVRLTDHGLARVLGQPLPAAYKVTRYRLIETLMSDLGIYFNAYWIKIRAGGEIGLLRVPPTLVTVKGGLVPLEYQINLNGALDPRMLSPEEVVHFRGYNAESQVLGLSPLETLRRVLAEEHSAGEYRERFWQNAARMGGIIERPADAPEWSDAARTRFKAEFEALYAGSDNSGKTAILEEGMEWKPATFNPQESEYMAGRKLSREECARAYHIPLPLVGILDHATFSNIKEQHKNLYQDSLGPWLKMIEEEIELQLLPEFGDSQGVYCEFNIAEKLAGSFEEQTTSLQSAVGRPWMTANEARARMNLPRLDQEDADRVVTPLNVLVGGQASPRDSAPDGAPESSGDLAPVGKKAQRSGIGTHRPEMRAAHEKKWREVLSRHYRRQEAAIVSRVPAQPGKDDLGDGVWWDTERWNNELYEDLLRLNLLTAGAWAAEIAAMLEAEFSEDRMLPWLKEHSRIQAENLNQQTRDEVEEALRQDDALEAVKNVFAIALTSGVTRQALGAVTTASMFGSAEAANAGGLRTKTWVVNSSQPRDTHLRMDGETVGIRDRFSNGLRWPGDPSGRAEENANCQCSVLWN